MGLLKLSSWRKASGDTVWLHRGQRESPEDPDEILVTSLFTYSWRPVHDAVEWYRNRYPKARIVLGGIYATLMPEHAALAGADEVHAGLVPEVEGTIPDYSLVPDWKSSILFATRGCIRKCAFCAVPRLEGKTWGPAGEIRPFVGEGHRKVVLWDNNVLGVPNWQAVVDELRELKLPVDFNQGLDARLMTDASAQSLSGLKIDPIRMAYDIPTERKALERAIPALEAAGFRRKRITVYTLFNFTDSPEDFFHRVRDLLNWGVVSYPMRYEPLNSLTKNKYISPHWTLQQLEMVARARRVIGFGGAFPPYEGLVAKFQKARTFEEAFGLREHANEHRIRSSHAGTVEERTGGLTEPRSEFRELLNDPMTLDCAVRCMSCGHEAPPGDRVFAVQDYAGAYVGHVCPRCHPNRKWVNALWRKTFSDDPWTAESPAALTGDVVVRTVH